MNPVLKIVLLSLLAVTAAIAGVGALLPHEWKTSKSVMIAAAPAAIHPWVEDFHQWEKWATKNSKVDLTYKFEGSEKGAGAVQVVSGARGGTGRMTITRSEPQLGIWYETQKDGEPATSGSITFKEAAGVTTITWEEQGDLPWIWGPFMRDPTQKQVGAYFEQALLALKDQVESSS